MTTEVDAGLLVERTPHCLLLTLNRPQKANSLDPALVDALLEHVDTAAEDGTRLMVLRSNGRHFCAGFDFTDLDHQSDGELLLRFVRIEQLLQKIYHAPFATLALAHGRAMGAGADLFVACNRRIATSDTAFAFPGARFGLILGTRRLGTRIGAANVRELISSGQSVPASWAHGVGLVNEIQSMDGWSETVQAHARTCAVLDPATQATLNQITNVDTRDEDMTALVASAAKPGLGQRIRTYRELVERAPSGPSLSI